MADNVDITAGSGTGIATDQVTGTLEHVQLVKLAIATDGSRTLIPADGTDGILVNLGTNNDVTVTSGSITATQGTAANLNATVVGTVTANAGTNLNTSALALEAGGNLAGVRTAVELIDDGVATVASPITTKGMAAVGTDGTNARILKTDTSGELQVDVLTMPTTTVTATNLSTNLAQVAGSATATGNGTAAGSLRVSVASDSTGQIALATGSNTIGALTANQSVNVAQMNGAATTMGNGISGTGVQRVTIASDSTGQVTLATGSNTIGALTANQSVNLAQVAGSTTATGNGTAAGSIRVSVASDSTGVVGLNTGTNTVGNVGLATRTTGGLTTYHLVSAATTNATNIKNAAGTLYGWYVYNNNAAMRKVALHNTSGTPTAGASIFFTINVPPTSAANVFSDIGIAFSSGIAITTVTDNTDAGTTAVGSGDLTINLFYA